MNSKPPPVAEGRAWRWLAAACLALLLATLGGHGARAQSCTFSISTIDFGQIMPITGPSQVDTTGTLSVSCTKLGLLGLLPLTITVCPNLAGGSAGTSGSNRLMTTGSATLPYQLFQDSNRTQIWGAAALLAFGATPTFTFTSDSSGNITASKPIYARLYPSASAPVANYSTTFSGQSFYWGLNILSCAGVTIGAVATPSTFTVQAELQGDCTLAVGSLNFGTKGVLKTATGVQGTVTPTCSNGTPYTVGFGNGATGTGPTARKMTKGSEAITYGIYKDSGYATAWGATASNWAAGTGTGAAQGIPVYGLVPAQKTPSPGAYGDTVVTTLTF